MTTHALAKLSYEEASHCYRCEGNWSISTIQATINEFNKNKLPKSKTIQLDGTGLTQLDSAGALGLMQCIQALKKHKNTVELIHFNEQQQALITLIESKMETLHYAPPVVKNRGILYFIGKEAINKLHQMDGLIILIGSLSDTLFSAFGEWRRFRLKSIAANIDTSGLHALPIVGLLSFLIGIVLAYQMGLQLETYGASIFIAYLSGMAIFREFAPLITAIIVAGRTSSAYTAQIGSMKINQEIDALYTMGLSPIELLVAPKVLGLLFIFPLLIFWSDFFSTLGAMLMAKHMLHVGYIDFMTRLQSTVGLKQLMLGLYKAPAFAILIALVGCFQGFRVEASADSLGHQTTKSVVQALFLIIIADACFSVMYSWLGL